MWQIKWKQAEKDELLDSKLNMIEPQGKCVMKSRGQAFKNVYINQRHDLHFKKDFRLLLVLHLKSLMLELHS